MKKLITTLVFEKNANFLPQIVIITSTPGLQLFHVGKKITKSEKGD
jgi:hypothetical protein